MRYQNLLPNGAALQVSKSRISNVEGTLLSQLINANARELVADYELASWGMVRADDAYGIWYTGRSPSQRIEELVSSDETLANLVTDGDIQYFHSGGRSSFGRLADNSPFFGGSRTNGPNPVVTICSDGFGVHNVNETPYMLVSAHCLKPTDTRVWTNIAGNNILIGSVATQSLDYDVGLASTSPSGQSVGQSVYSGTHGQSDQDTQFEHVIGYQPWGYGDYVCADGSVSYARCKVVRVGSARQVTNHNAYTNASYTSYGVDVYSTDGTWIWAHGDSGGPVIYLVNSTQVRAYGIISYQYNSVACPSWITDNVCTDDGVMTLMSDIVTQLNAHLTW